ncbi:MAG TPA: hypothetical protein VMS63_03565 [Gaiellaceae bacterium]|jgi:hypothetical protein|nr:hypothetical protein [Gaiellaceae bacterium]
MSGRRLVTVLPLFATLAVLAAGCGGGSKAPYTAKGTVKCLTGKGFTNATTDPLKVGFIAGVAENGGLRAVAPSGNVLTIAFARDAADAASTKEVFRENATPFYRRHMADIMESQRNAVLVWTTSPSQVLLTTVLHCLAS